MGAVIVMYQCDTCKKVNASEALRTEDRLPMCNGCGNSTRVFFVMEGKGMVVDG